MKRINDATVTPSRPRATVSSMVRTLAREVLRALPFRSTRHRLFVHSTVATPRTGAKSGRDTRILILGVYLADRANSVEHLVERLASGGGLHVQHRWMALNGAPTSPLLEQVTAICADHVEPKFVLINRLLQPDDFGSFDFIVVCDDDIFVPLNFLPAFIAYQTMFDFAVAQPARAWHSHFDHAFVLRRPGLLARQTRFVESGPFVSFRMDAARLLMPFDTASRMWGLDLVWSNVLGQHALTLGIVDKTPVDHSLRPQAVAYKKEVEDLAMHQYLATTPHLPMQEAFTIVKRYWSVPRD